MAERILDSQYDIIAFNEAFDEGGNADFKEQLVSRLREYYPHYIQYIDDDEANFDEDSGLMLFSRYPFIPIENNPNKADDVIAVNGPRGEWDDIAFQEFEDLKMPPQYCTSFQQGGPCYPNDACSGYDCQADKGVAYVRIRNRYTGRVYNVYFTHLQSGKDQNPDSYEAAIRQRQLQAVGEFIQKTANGEDVFVLGDLNIDGDFLIERCH